MPVLDMSSDELHTLKTDKITKIDGLITDVQNQDRLSPQRLVELRREMENLYKEPNAVLEQQGIAPQGEHPYNGFSRFVASMAYGGHSLHFANEGIHTSEQQFLGIQNNKPPEMAPALKVALGLQ